MSTQSLLQSVTSHVLSATKVSIEVNEVLHDTQKLIDDVAERAQRLNETLASVAEQSLDMTAIANEIIQEELNFALDKHLDAEKVEALFTEAVNELDLDQLTATMADSEQMIDNIRDKVREFLDTELINKLPDIEGSIVELKHTLFDSINSSIGIKVTESTQALTDTIAEELKHLIDQLTDDIQDTIDKFIVDTEQDESQTLQAAINQLEPAFEAVKSAIDELTRAAEPFGISVE